MADTTIDINKSNAYDTYSRYRRGELDLSKAQVAECESYLTAEEEDEINYSEEVRQHDAASKIDTENTDEKGGAATATAASAGTAAATGTTILAVCKCIHISGKGVSLSGYASLAASIVAAAGAAIALVFAAAFDPALKDRKAKAEQSTNDNATIDSYSDALAGSMEMMAEDEKLYQEQAQLLTLTRNQQTSRNAELQMQYETAVKMGDTAGAESAKAEMQQLQNTDNSELEGELAETAGAIGEYRTMNTESTAVKESGQQVSSFLEKGKPMAVVALANAIAASATTLLIGGLQLLGVIPKMGIFDAMPAMASGILWGVAGLTMGATAAKMFTTYKNENECGNAGDEMKTHIDGLNEMISAQDSRTNATESVFGKIDTEATTAQGNAETSANTAIEQNDQILGNNSGAGTGAGSGSGNTGTGGGTGEG